MKEKHGTLLKNTVMLALLQLSTYLLALITIPSTENLHRKRGKEIFSTSGR